MEVGRELGPAALLLVNLSGRGDKDMHTAATYFGLIDEDAQQAVLPDDTADEARGLRDKARVMKTVGCAPYIMS